MKEKSSLEVREEVVDTDSLGSLLDEFEEVQKREQEIKKALKTLMERL